MEENRVLKAEVKVKLQTAVDGVVIDVMKDRKSGDIEPSQKEMIDGLIEKLAREIAWIHEQNPSS